MRAAAWVRALGAAGVFASALAAPAWAGPRLSCTADVRGRRVLVDATATTLLDEDLERLVRLGLQGRITVEVTLHRPRHFWFAERVAATRKSYTVSWSKADRALLLDGVVAPAGMPLHFGPLAVGTGDVKPGARYDVEVTMALTVVTAQSLGESVNFLLGRTRAEAEDTDGAGVPRVLLQAIASDLEREAQTTCRALPPAAAGGAATLRE